MLHTLEKVFCLSLRTFGLVIGWLGAAGSSLMIILSACALGYSNEIADYMLRSAKVPIDADNHADANSDVVLLGTIYLVSSLIGVLVSSLLIFGILKNRYLAILPWLIVNGTGLVLNVLYLIGAFYAMFVGSPENIIRFFVPLAYFALSYYISSGICSLYKQMSKSSRHQPLE
ncbi:uncharacterized protein LOC132789750 [Drosophila nasuta]|uniref:uncharacterized protein LOC132789750 n=1 Tax=Drosophila nasuta TaxID=42062 RepID=UPI00295F2E93|nr:uncharacterized protein LOC132789750 [Drosophila nasuta]